MSDASPPKTVAIIGAGPAGITAAYQLTKKGVSVRVFEVSSSVGGLARTIDLWGQKVDLGPHRFLSNDPRVNQIWFEVIGEDFDMVDRLTRIYYQGRFLFYPLKPLNALGNLGVLEATRCMTSYGVQRFRRATGQSCFEDWVVNRFGRRLFEIFFKTYSEKLWGVPCSEIDSDFAAQRIKKLSLSDAIRNAFGARNGTKHKTLADQFAYPHGGSGELYTRMAEYVQRNGGTVECGQPIRRVLAQDGRVTRIEFENGEQSVFDEVISTMPLNQLVKRLPDVPPDVAAAAESLRFRNTILVYLKVEETELFPDNWLYIHSPELLTGRVTNFRNWVPQLYGSDKATILALEYWCNDHDTTWSQSDESLVALAKKELRKSGLIKTAPISAGHVHRIRRCYPVYDRGYKTRLKPIERYLSRVAGLTVIGRYGAFKYNNQDHSILMGLLAAENIADGKSHNLWSVNTDYEYQEDAVITQSGLSRQFPKPAELPAPTPSAALHVA